jgi:putative ABC transport system permease protein
MRSGLTGLGVLLGVAIAIAVQLANHTALHSFERGLKAVTGDAVWQVQGQASDMPDSVLYDLRLATGVAQLRPVLEGTAVSSDHPDQALKILGIDLTQIEAVGNGITPVAGTFLMAQPYPVALLSPEAVSALGVRTGQLMRWKVQDRVVTVRVGPLRPNDARTASLDPYVALMDLADAQEVLGRIGRLDRVDIAPLSGVAESEIEAVMTPLMKRGVVLARPSESIEQARRMLLSFRVNLMALSFVALIVGAYLIYNTVAISVVQRRREVGILRTLGMSRAVIIWLFLLEAGAIGLVGGLLGIVAGSLLARGAVEAVGRTVNAIYLATPVTGVVYDPLTLVSGLAIGVGLALLAAGIPAWEASQTPAATVTRAGTWEGQQREGLLRWSASAAFVLIAAWEASQLPPLMGLPVGGYAAAALLIVAFSMWGPLSVRIVTGVAGPWCRRVGGLAQLAVRNFERAVGRNAVAIAALMVGLAMMIGVSTMVSSFRDTVVRWVDHTLPGTYYLKPELAVGARQNITMSADWIARMKALPDVAAVEGFRTRAIAYNGTTVRLGASDMAVLAEFGSLMLTNAGDPKKAYAALIGQDRVLVSEALTIKQGVVVGSRLALDTPQGTKHFEVMGTYRDYASDQGYILMDRGTYRRYWQDDAITDLAIYASPGADTERLRVRIHETLGGAPISVTSSATMRAQVLTVFDQTFAITDALHLIALSVSLLGVVGSLYALVLERQREWSILRQLGLSTGQLLRLVVFEAGLIGVAGVMLGTVAGLALSWLLVEVINRQSFGWTVTWQSPGLYLLKAGAVIIICAMLAGILPARVAARTPIAEGLRHE